MTQVKRIEMFACGVCKSAHDSEAMAETCLKDCESKARRQKIAEKRKALNLVISDHVRLRAETVEQIPDLIIEYAKKHYGLEVTLKNFPGKFGMQSNSHACPIGGKQNWGRKKNMPEGYLGWAGQITGTMKPLKGKYKGDDLDPGIGYLFDDGFENRGFRGFHIGTGSCGSQFNISLTYFLDDFPKIKAKYEEHQRLHKIATEHEAFENLRNQNIHDHANFQMRIDPKVEDLQRELDRTEAKIKRLNSEAAKLAGAISKVLDGYIAETTAQKEEMWPTPKELEYDHNHLVDLGRAYNYDPYNKRDY